MTPKPIRRPWPLLALALAILCASAGLHAYPLDGFETGIRRLEGSRLANEGKVKDVERPPGALPRHGRRRAATGRPDLRPARAGIPEFTRRIAASLTGNMSDYGLAVLDLSDPARPRYAEHRADHRQNVGSVGKLVVALALFQALADLHPDDVEARRRVLKNTVVTADAFSGVRTITRCACSTPPPARSCGARCAWATARRCTSGWTGCCRRVPTPPPAC